MTNIPSGENAYYGHGQRVFFNKCHWTEIPRQSWHELLVVMGITAMETEEKRLADLAYKKTQPSYKRKYWREGRKSRAKKI